jgi:DNA polymerase-3 subunit beta
MKFTVERDALAEAVTWVARALPARPVVPVLSGLLLTATPAEPHIQNGVGILTLSCFDYEVSARIRVPAEVADPGTVLVPGRLLVEIVRALPPKPVEFADDPDGISVICGDADFTVTRLPSADYPELPELPQRAGTVDGGVFAAAIGQVTPAASRDDTLPMLTAVNLELAGTTMTLAATDRYRLAVRDLDWQPAPGFDDLERTAFLVPARTLADAARLMSAGTAVRLLFRHVGDASGGDAAGAGTGAAGTGIAGIGAQEAMIGFEAGNRRLTTRLLAGEFVRYRSRFPDEFDCTADIPAEAFAEAVRRVALVAERGTPVQLTFTPGRVTIGAGTQGTARARESLPADFTGDQPSIAFSPHYLLDGIVAAAAVVSRGGDPPYPPHVAAGGSDGKERHRIGPASADGGGVSGVSAYSPGGGGGGGVSGVSAYSPGGGGGESGDLPYSRQAGSGALAAHGQKGAAKAGGNTDAAAVEDGSEPERVRLWFSGPTKPAVITREPLADTANGASDFRYLVVPQRVTAA